MKKLTIVFLCLCMLILPLLSCGGEGTAQTPSEPTETPDIPEQSDKTETPDEPEQPDTPDEPETVVLDIVVDGVSDYTVVYDDSDDYIAAQALAFVASMKEKYGVALTAFGASEAEDDYGHEIVIGRVRDSADKVAAHLNDAGDFAICIEGDDWVMVATGSRLYAYLFKVLENRRLAHVKEGNLQFDSKKDFIYHDSPYKKRTYLEYCYGNAKMTRETLAEIFEARNYTAKDGTKIAYRLYVPFDYDATKEYPVLLLLHGAGERGNDNTGNLVHLVSELFNVPKTPVKDAIIVAPQCPAGNQWVDTPWANGSYDTSKVKLSNELRAVMEIMDEVEAEFSTDYDRYYVMGLSMGGFGTWDLLMRNPDYFAAGIPICGGADPNMAEALIDVPIRTFHGAADSVVPVSGTREMAAALEAAGSTAFLYEEIAGADHGIWGGVASRKDVIDWLFSQRLSDR